MPFLARPGTEPGLPSHILTQLWSILRLSHLRFDGTQALCQNRRGCTCRKPRDTTEEATSLWPSSLWKVLIRTKTLSLNDAASFWIFRERSSKNQAHIWGESMAAPGMRFTCWETVSSWTNWSWTPSIPNGWGAGICGYENKHLSDQTRKANPPGKLVREFASLLTFWPWPSHLGMVRSLKSSLGLAAGCWDLFVQCPSLVNTLLQTEACELGCPGPTNPGLDLAPKASNLVRSSPGPVNWHTLECFSNLDSGG